MSSVPGIIAAQYVAAPAGAPTMTLDNVYTGSNIGNLTTIDVNVNIPAGTTLVVIIAEMYRSSPGETWSTATLGAQALTVEGDTQVAQPNNFSVAGACFSLASPPTGAAVNLVLTQGQAQIDEYAVAVFVTSDSGAVVDVSGNNAVDAVTSVTETLTTTVNDCTIVGGGGMEDTISDPASYDTGTQEQNGNTDPTSNGSCVWVFGQQAAAAAGAHDVTCSWQNNEGGNVQAVAVKRAA